MFRAVLFDLDGTITDSAEGITKSVQYALLNLGIQVSDPRELTCFVGPALFQQFQQYAGLNPQQATLAVQKFRERFSKVGIYENAVYEGIEKVLKELKEQGVILAIASSKPQVFVHQVLDYFHLTHYFDIIVGSELDGRRTQKEEVIQTVLKQLNLEDVANEVLMVGDRYHDIEGAKKCGTTSLGVAYGYGGREELIKARADYIVDSVEELTNFFAIDSKPIEKEELYKERVRHYHGIGLKIWRSIYPIGIHYGASFLASVVGTVAIFSFLALSMRVLSSEDMVNEVYKHTLLLTFIGQLIALPFLAYFYKKDQVLRGNYKRGHILHGFKKIPKVHWVFYYIFAGCLGVGFSNIIDLVGIPKLFPGYSELSEIVFQNQNLFLSMLAVGIFAPIVEELAFRGLMCRRISEYLSDTWGIVLSSIAFGIIHGNMVQFIFAVPLGAVMAIFYKRTGTLWVPIMLHVGVNMTSTLLSEFVKGYANIWVFLGTTLLEVIVVTILGKYLWKATSKETSNKKVSIEEVV